ncbi:protoporphyrinogen oxidase [Kineococcus rubinsiae]|uniref:protoporphyrinogen oxidase n=1 Tax=Kineococcus rubinsiae TaxID=2609562 RepID=UPI0014319BD3|nr:protoporphyrinogen oxidase [Kineococcus rubinsiae]NIZ89771.1 protoporphyrinogen oxidase [Kineococcus rubinsiae]
MPEQPPAATAGAPPLVVVVGGGVSGLSAAWRLASAGVRVQVLEASPRLGGVLDRVEVGGVVVDTGAESVLARRPEAVELVRAVGLGEDLVHPETARASVRTEGALRPLPTGTVMGVPGSAAAVEGLLAPADVERVAAEPGLPAPPLDADVSVGDYVASRVGRAVVDRLVEPLLGGVYAGHAARLSLQATVPALWKHARAGGSLLEAVSAAAARPAATTPVFAGIRGGVSRLPEALAAAVEARGGTLRRSAPVTALTRTATGWRLQTPDGGVDADAVVLAVPAPVAARLLRGPVPAAATELAGVETASMVIAALAVPTGQLAGLAGSGVLVPPVVGRAEGLQVKALTLSANKWAWVAAQDPDVRVVRVSLGRARETAVLERDDADVLATAAADASLLLGRPLTAVAGSVTRWVDGLPQYAVGHVDRVARVRAAVAEAGALAVCGSVLDGVGVPACIAAADRAAADVLAALATSGGAAPG